jgi:hypothetical protein
MLRLFLFVAFDPFLFFFVLLVTENQSIGGKIDPPLPRSAIQRAGMRRAGHTEPTPIRRAPLAVLAPRESGML